MSKENTIKELKVGNRILRIFQDENPENPRAWENISKMIFFTRNSTSLGDKHSVKLENPYSSRQDFIDNAPNEIRKQIKGVVVCKAVHMYDHSGVSISTSFSYPFSCKWDSGTIGFVVVTKEDICKNFGVKRVTKKLIEKAEVIAVGEVETLNQYVTGDIYGFEIVRVTNDGEEHEDSCWGFYGNDFATNGITDHLDKEMAEALKGVA